MVGFERKLQFARGLTVTNYDNDASVASCTYQRPPACNLTVRIARNNDTLDDRVVASMFTDEPYAVFALESGNACTQPAEGNRLGKQRHLLQSDTIRSSALARHAALTGCLVRLLRPPKLRDMIRCDLVTSLQLCQAEGRCPRFR